MAIIKCPECNKEISDKATICPNCGCPISNVADQPNTTTSTKNKPINGSILIAIAVAFVFVSIIFGIYFVNKCKVSTPYEKAGKESINVIDDYLDYKITEDECEESLRQISERLNNEADDSTDDFIMKIEIEQIAIGLDSMSSSDIVKSRNKIAKLVGSKLK